jgi:hypothetical protein
MNLVALMINIRSALRIDALHLRKNISLALQFFDINLFELRVPNHVPVSLTLSLRMFDVDGLKESLALHALLLGL